MDKELKRIQRREVLLRLKDLLEEKDLVVVALAGTTSDCFETMHRQGILYAVGMGMVTQVAFGLAVALPNRRVIALDTDGGLLLGPSILPVIGVYKPRNLRIIVFDNERLYGSRAGPPSQTAYGADLEKLAVSAGIERAGKLEQAGDLKSKLSGFLAGPGPAVLVAKIEAAFERGAPRAISGQENKFQFVRFVEEGEKIAILEGAK